jgi:hypothetical protein
MRSNLRVAEGILLFAVCAVCVCICALPRYANAAVCTTQAQMAPAQRDALVNTSRSLMSQVQHGDISGLRSNTIPAVAAEFDGIASSVSSLEPIIQSASITVDAVYDLDASGEAAGSPRTDFFCGSPVVAMNFTNLPPGKYGLAIVHATGVQAPQQVALILAKTADNRWMLGGFFAKPMTESGHDGLWYWSAARKYAQSNQNWDAWFYYRVAAGLLSPVDFLSSPNLQKLQRETDQSRPANLPGDKPVALNAQGSVFQVTAIDTTTALGSFDLDVHYLPNAAQAAQLRDRQGARDQVVEVMAALLALHPELHDAFHGMWVHADQGDASLFALELPMNSIVPGSPQAAAPAAR